MKISVVNTRIECAKVTVDRFGVSPVNELDEEKVYQFLKDNYRNSDLDENDQYRQFRVDAKDFVARFTAPKPEGGDELREALEELFSACKNLLPFKGSTKIYDSVENANTLYSAMERTEAALNQKETE
jgi:hypothetical protein